MSNEKSTMKSQTDWARVDALKPEDIDLCDCPEVTDELWAKGEMFGPSQSDSQERLPIDDDIIAYFKSEGSDYPVRSNHVLRDYIEEHWAG